MGLRRIGRWISRRAITMRLRQWIFSGEINISKTRPLVRLEALTTLELLGKSRPARYPIIPSLNKRKGGAGLPRRREVLIAVLGPHTPCPGRARTRYRPR